MDKKILKIIKLFIIILSLSMIKVGNVKGESSKIYSTEEDGVWRPTDKVSKTFKIENVWGKKCFLEGIEFSRSYIKDVDTNRQYSLKEAEKYKILDNVYDVKISEGDKEIYSGNINSLVDKTIEFENPIFMDLDFVKEFTITIEFDSLAGNNYQNKSYEYILEPKVFVLITDDSADERLSVLTKTGEVISKSTVIMVGIIIAIGGGIMIWLTDNHGRKL